MMPTDQNSECRTFLPKGQLISKANLNQQKTNEIIFSYLPLGSKIGRMKKQCVYYVKSQIISECPYA